VDEDGTQDFNVLVDTTDDTSEVVICAGVAGNIDEGFEPWVAIHVFIDNLAW
jgi:hypothetical protein